MQAAQLTSYDGPESMTINEVDKPELKPNQVLVKVTAASVNPFDCKVTLGYAKDWVDLKLPATLGGDVAGEVVEVGGDVNGFSVGQAVYGSANSLSGNGSFAEFTPLDTAKLAAVPTTVDLVTAAAYPLVGASAYQTLVQTAHIQAGQKVLIHGGAGGIGALAIQIAKNAGAYVATTAGTDDQDYVKSLGADEAIDYKTQDFSTMLSDYDIIYDTVGGETNKKSYQVLKAGGQLLSMAEQPDETLAAEHQVQATYISTNISTEILNELTKLIDSGKLIVNVDKTFPLSQAAEALSLVNDGHVRGKVVITV